MEEILLLALVLVEGARLVLCVREARKGRAQAEAAKLDEAVQEAMDEEVKRSRAVDEGFENLMGYTVKLGHGRSSGGEPL